LKNKESENLIKELYKNIENLTGEKQLFYDGINKQINDSLNDFNEKMDTLQQKNIILSEEIKSKDRIIQELKHNISNNQKNKSIFKENNIDKYLNSNDEDNSLKCQQLENKLIKKEIEIKFLKEKLKQTENSFFSNSPSSKRVKYFFNYIRTMKIHHQIIQIQILI
jgi:predicted RNase H-like nuclease (RuvC/YqgF family)